MALSRRGVLFLAVAGTVGAQNRTIISISVPPNLHTRVLAPDVYGYSIEPVWLDSYISTPLASTLLRNIADVTGKPPPIRVGGNTADQTYLYPTSPLPLTGNDSAAIPDPASATRFNITPRWFDSWATYFPPGTDLIYTLNLRDNSSSWANAVAEAAAAHAALGDKLVAFELGNEIDHFINKGWRDASWDVDEYIAQFRNLTGQITGSGWYRALTEPNNGTGSKRGGNADKRNEDKAPTFQAAVFADPPLVPDQQDEVDDFSIANLTAAGIVARPEEKRIVSSYAVHLYPQSACDTARWYRMRLDLLSDHAVLWKNVSQYIPQVAAADAAGAPLVMGETNSVSCSGRSGISDTFGAALWGVDYVLTAASIGFRKVYFHLGAQSEYSSFTPLPYEYKNETLAPGIRAGWYAHYFLARVVRDRRTNPPRCGEMQSNDDVLRVAALPGANSSELSGFAVYAGEEHNDHCGNTGRDSRYGHEHSAPGTLRKLVFLDMGVWNGTEGLANPSTLSATDGTMFSKGTRPVSSFEVRTPWAEGGHVTLVRLSAPGTNAKSNVTVAGTVFDNKTGDALVGEDGVRLGDEYSEIIQVGAAGVLKFSMQRAEAVLLEVIDDGKGMDCAGGGPAGGGQNGDDGEDANSQDGSAPATSRTLQAPTSGSESNVDSSMSEQSQTGISNSTATGAGVNTGAGTTREKTEAEIEADRLYEEAMEEEYAKREGGA
ncbi:glycoside hydrolase superfamily [Xylaria sp. FL0043]|nr:glycoside hydrolase superfamily [Xylaria sp. FL0043]